MAATIVTSIAASSLFVNAPNGYLEIYAPALIKTDMVAHIIGLASMISLFGKVGVDILAQSSISAPYHGEHEYLAYGTPTVWDGPFQSGTPTTTTGPVPTAGTLSPVWPFLFVCAALVCSGAAMVSLNESGKGGNISNGSLGPGEDPSSEVKSELPGSPLLDQSQLAQPSGTAGGGGPPTPPPVEVEAALPRKASRFLSFLRFVWAVITVILILIIKALYSLRQHIDPLHVFQAVVLAILAWIIKALPDLWDTLKHLHIFWFFVFIMFLKLVTLLCGDPEEDEVPEDFSLPPCPWLGSPEYATLAGNAFTYSVDEDDPDSDGW